ncbi:hypothetical protein N8083_00155 [Candidatus Pacebacteria bacterium]|nr:hypothetical protein [Candidatus Paceibacterota bacterium]
MFNNTQVLQKTSWTALVVFASGFFVAGISALGYMFASVAKTPLAFLVLVTVGLVMATGGYILTKRSQYEMFPLQKQIFGALINGVLGGVMLLALVRILFEGLSAIPLISFLVAVGLFVEFLSLRISQSGKVSLLQIVSVVLVGGSFYLLQSNGFVASQVQNVSLFVGALIAMELVSRTTKTYLLSPWVNSIWNGLAILVVSAVSFPYIVQIELLKDVNMVLTLPLWVGIGIALLGVVVLSLRFLKQKIRVAKGYMQYKLQFLTACLGVLSILAVLGKVPTIYFIVFGMLVLAYSIMEGRLMVKE